MGEKELLSKKLQAAAFALNDIKLFLDSHPNDRNALECFCKYQKIYMELLEEYESKYGALTANRVNTNNGWTWIENPWPWELEANR